MAQDGDPFEPAGDTGDASDASASTGGEEDSLIRAAAEISDPSISGSDLIHLATATRDKPVEGAVIAKRYRLDRLLGGGGMGVVWQATHVVTRRQVALKFIVRHALHRAEFRRRFLREARAASAVRHPNVVQVLDVFELEDHSPVMVMEYLSGETLRSVIAREGKLSVEATVSILLPVTMAVAAAHEAGVIHRDLKPENIFLVQGLARPEGVKVLDFGVAKFEAGDFQSEAESLTSTGAAPGTPCYMAPEQATGDKDVDARADVWALGVVLYECLAGVRPIEASGIGQAVMKLMTEGIKPLDRIVAGLPPDVTALVARMLSRERVDRPQTLREVSDVLARFVSGGASAAADEPPAPRSGATVARSVLPRRAAFAAAGACVASVVWSVFTPPRSPPAAQVAGAVTSEQTPLVASAVVVPRAAEVTQTPSPADPVRSTTPTPGSRPPPAKGPPRSAPSASAPAPAASGPSNLPPAKADCEPPYEFDGEGRKLWKRQCL